MNDVSWKKILEQADSRQPFGRNQDAPHAPARARAPEQHSQQNADFSYLESELARVTHHRGASAADAQPKTRRQHQTSPGQHATQLKMRMEQRASAREVVEFQPLQAKAANPSGARNLIAISLSLAVVCYAAYELSESMPQTSSDGEVSTAQHANTAAYADIGSAQASNSEIQVTGNRVDLRPSLASQTDWAGERRETTDANVVTGALDSANVTDQLPQEQPAALESGESETRILNRGRDILDRGHVSGARLIFEYLADRGSALGAFALAQTYDGKYISKHNLPTDAADEAMASKWYQKAADMTDTAKAD